MITELLSQRLGVTSVLYPASQSAATVNMAAVNLAKAAQHVFVVQTGTVGTNATVDFRVQGATASNGTYANINATAITQVTAANSVAKVVIRTDQVNALALGYTHVRGQLTVAVNACVVGIISFAGDAYNEPASGLDGNNVAQTVVL